MYSPYRRQSRPRWRDGYCCNILHAQRRASFAGKTAHEWNWRLANARLRQTTGGGPLRKWTPQTRQPAFGESEMIPLEKGFVSQGLLV